MQHMGGHNVANDVYNMLLELEGTHKEVAMLT